MRILIFPAVAFALSGCIVVDVAETAVGVATLPVKVAAKTVDLATTSQAEADQRRGRKMREAEAQYGRALTRWERECEEAIEANAPCPERPAFEPPA
ncbi:hypothetical protein [Sphingomicrobium astaxanthinifaciens]|uniref:hypothetical protein n=1 Tax=Sphingomicrobium astaxanthinifaciens TaxID=1227949 RepID=UPI001FCBC066|nr:hypothetical protein [Sphingomicrobium astaxanthinifaciens]MCJ7420907.1 hypothetical protein [Sphingomicrobium astaxanthinifaciens]